MRSTVRLAKALLSRWGSAPTRQGAGAEQGDHSAVVALPDPDPDPDPDPPVATVEPEKPAQVAPPKDYLVVYQFGKVASSAIVDSLNRLPGVSAVQSHVPGLKMLRDTLGQLVDSGEYWTLARTSIF